jgi:hypothetical protein
LEFKHESSDLQKFDNTDNISKMAPRVKAIVTEAGATNLASLFEGDFVIGSVQPENIGEILDLCLTQEESKTFPLYDLLRCVFLVPESCTWAAMEGWDQICECLDRLESYSEAVGEPVEAESPIQKTQGTCLFTASQAITNLLIHDTAAELFSCDQTKVERLIQFGAFLVRARRFKTVNNAVAIMMNLFVAIEAYQEEVEEFYTQIVDAGFGYVSNATSAF